jgi:molybdate transport system substrate-binding protein
MRRQKSGLALIVVTQLVTSGVSARAQGLTIAAASDLQAVLPQVVARFERQSGLAARITFGSSGNFFAQIQNGAPFDVFLSADIDYPRRLEQTGLGEPGTLYEYATGEIVLWALKNGGPDLSSGLQALLSPTVRRIAIANPEHAPYGRAAVAALRSAGIYDRVKSKLVLGENISQAAQFVRSGNADAGIIARSIALMPGLSPLGTTAMISSTSYPPIDQAAIVIRASRNKDAARSLLAFLKTPEILSLMEEFGFKVQAPAR